MGLINIFNNIYEILFLKTISKTKSK